MVLNNFCRKEQHATWSRADFGWRKEDLSVEPNTPGKDTPDDKCKAVPAADQLATQPDKTPAEVAPAPKS
jgi:hypothetical protein